MNELQKALARQQELVTLARNEGRDLTAEEQATRAARPAASPPAVSAARRTAARAPRPEPPRAV